MTSETRVVPVEPTEEMLLAGAKMFESTLHSYAGLDHHAYHVYGAMLAAAPSAPVGELAEATEKMCDAVRGILQVIRNSHGALMQNVILQCDRRGDDMSLWPTWAIAYEGYVTENAAAKLIYEIMRALEPSAIAQPVSDAQINTLVFELARNWSGHLARPEYIEYLQRDVEAAIRAALSAKGE